MRARAWRGSYRALGLNPGDRLASLMPNRIALVVHYLACFKAGLVATPLNYRYATPEIDHALEVSDASALVVHVERQADIAATRLGIEPPCRCDHVRRSRRCGVAGDRDARGVDRGQGRRRRGRCARARRACRDLLHLGEHRSGEGRDPQHGDARLDDRVGGTRVRAHAGRRVPARFVDLAHRLVHVDPRVLPRRARRSIHAQAYDAGEVLPLLRAHRPTVLAMIPAALTALVRDHDVSKADFSSLRICRCGADKVSDELEREFTHLVGFLIDEGYGMTEVGLATLNPPYGKIQPGSIGTCIPGVEIALPGRRRRLRGGERRRRQDLDQDPEPDGRLLGEPGGHCGDHARRLARLR